MSNLFQVKIVILLHESSFDCFFSPVIFLFFLFICDKLFLLNVNKMSEHQLIGRRLLREMIYQVTFQLLLQSQQKCGGTVTHFKTQI